MPKKEVHYDLKIEFRSEDLARKFMFNFYIMGYDDIYKPVNIDDAQTTYILFLKDRPPEEASSPPAKYAEIYGWCEKHKEHQKERAITVLTKPTDSERSLHKSKNEAEPKITGVAVEWPEGADPGFS